MITKTQQELLDYLASGGKVLHVNGRDSYWFRTDNHKRVSNTIFALKRKGLLEMSEDNYKWQIELTKDTQQQ